ncbi:MAG: isoprenylcysteine carboxylmethyltransferase family protein [Anaerolineales bacterium]|jgi:protein-S-isoprenylcysteine O-methyltransferase Ste14
MKAERTNQNDRRELLLPRWAIPLVWAVIVCVIQVLLPWAVSNIGIRFGWSQQVPGPWNLAGLPLVVAGITLYAWCLLVHFRSYRTSVKVGFSPPHLVYGGLYRFSRNPMYISGLIAWFGWIVYYGSPAVLLGLVLLWLFFALRMIPQEERQLEELFGEDYLAYKRTVRRWLGRF